MNHTRIKICGITQVSDAIAAAECGVDAIGLVFYPPSPRAISVQQAQDIVSALPAFVTVVGLFVDAAKEELTQVLDSVPLDLLQFHGNEQPGYCGQFNRPYIKAVRVRDDMNIKSLIARYPDAKGYLLDTYRKGTPGGTGEVFNWSLIPDDIKSSIILAGGLNTENVVAAITEVNPYAVDVSGGLESSPGIKDLNKINLFVRGVHSVNRD